MAWTEKYMSLKNVAVTLQSGLVADITELSVKRTLELADRTAGPSKLEQQVIVKEKMPEITINGWNSDDLALADLTPGTQITAFTVTDTAETPASALWTDFFTKWPIAGMTLGDTDTTLGEQPSKWSTRVLCGVLNPDFA